MRLAATLLRKSLGSQQQAVPLPDGAAWKPQWVAADDQLLGEALLLISRSSLATDELSAEEFEELVDYFKAKQAHRSQDEIKRRMTVLEAAFGGGRQDFDAFRQAATQAAAAEPPRKPAAVGKKKA